MQLQLTQDETKLLRDVLQEAAPRNPICAALLDRVAGRDLRFGYDDLEKLSDVLADTSGRLFDQLLRAEDAALRRKQDAVRRMLDKVIEAEARV